MKKKGFLISAAAAAVITGIISAYILTERSVEIKDKEDIASDEESVEIYRPQITSEPDISSPEPTVEPIYYMVMIEKDKLCLLEINGNARKTVKSAKITPEVLPSEDVELLKNGIHALSLEEGIEIMENFIS